MGSIVDAGNGNDAISSGTGSDTLMGGSGNDTIDGSAGDDNITGGTGADSLTSGAGADTFIFGNSDTGITQATGDTVTDFTAGDFFDFAQVAGTVANYTEAAADIGADVVVFADINGDGTADQVITLSTVADLTTIGFGNFI